MGIFLMENFILRNATHSGYSHGVNRWPELGLGTARDPESMVDFK